MSVHSQGAKAARFHYALEFIRRRPLDGRLYISLCDRDYYRLRRAAEDLHGESRWPRFEYNGPTSRATITTFPSYLSTLGCGSGGGTRNGIFDTQNCAAVIEWTTEQCSDIQGDVRLYLYGLEYKAVIVARIEESPQYHSPVEVDILRAEFSDIWKKSPLGPYVYGNFAWAGRIANLFLDVYKRRGKTGEPEVTRHFIIQDGQCITQGKMNLNLTIGELAPTAEVTNSNKRTYQ
ncbi:hypothetical protein V1517DRAFT_308153 [Lipomyces orientalis]|uniref:Uncharacterized protein n=1 Tax=Lipomyces orientalis TaxID=1233043 RepID=A0ACC3TM61_9ASCO